MVSRNAVLDSVVPDPPTIAIAMGHLVPRLAAGVELIGEYQGSGFTEPKFIVARPDGQVIQLPRLLFAVLAGVDGRRDLRGLASRVSMEFGRDLDASQVGFLIEQKLRPALLIADDDRMSGPPSGDPGGADASGGVAGSGVAGSGVNRAGMVRSDPLLALKHRAGVVSAGASWTVAGVFGFLYRPLVLVTALAGFAAVETWLVVHGVLAQVGPAAVGLIQSPLLNLLVIVLTVGAGAFHECGHVTACRYGGARPGVMGVGLYLVWPAFYSTVTDSYRLNRRGRLRTDLGGVYFNALFLTGVDLAFLGTRASWLLVFVVLWHVETLRQFLPSIRLDGYYILSDLIGVPDLFSRLIPVLVGMLPGRVPGPRVRDLQPWVRRVITIWVVLVIPTLVFMLVVFLIAVPQVLPVVWASLLRLLIGVVAAVQAGMIAAAVLGVVQTVFLLLPWVGFALIVSGFTRTGLRLVQRRWPRRRPTADTAQTPPAPAPGRGHSTHCRTTPLTVVTHSSSSRNQLSVALGMATAIAMTLGLSLGLSPPRSGVAALNAIAVAPSPHPALGPSSGSTAQGAPEAGNAPSTSMCRMRVTADELKDRLQPRPDGIIWPTTLSRGDVIAATTTVVNNFRRLGDGTWAAEKYLRSESGDACRPH